MLLLLCLSVERRLTVEGLIVERMPEYFPTDPDDTVWIRRRAWRTGITDVERERVRKLVDDDLERLQLMGFGACRETVGDNGEELDEECVVLHERPFVPVSLDPADVPTVVSLVAAFLSVGATGADPPIRALEFARAATAGVLVDMRREGRDPIRVVPVRVVLRPSGRWYGIGVTTDSRHPLTFRLAPDNESGPRWDPSVTDVLVPAWAEGLEVDAELLLHPLTWGDDPFGVAVTVDLSAADRVRGLVGPARVEESVTEGSAEFALRVTDSAELVRRLAPYAWAVQSVAPACVADALRDHLRAMVESPTWLPSDVVPLDAVLAPMRSVPVLAEPEEDALLERAPVPPGRARKNVVNRMGTLLLVLRALRDNDGLTMDELVELTGFDARAVESLLTLYVAAEGSVANELPGRSANVRPLVLERDASGRVVRVRHDREVAARDDDISLMGRVEVTEGQLLTALAAALDLLEEEPEHKDAEVLRAFVQSAADALGVDADDVDGERLEPVPADPVRALVARAIHDGAFLSFSYTDPWTLRASGNRVQPFALRQARQQAIVDAVDLDASDLPAVERVRTFALVGMSDVRRLSGTEADQALAQRVDPDLLPALASRLLGTVTLAIRAVGEAADAVRYRWHGRTLTRPDGVVIAEVDLVQPVEDRLAAMLLECGADARVLFPERLRSLGAERAGAALAGL